MKYRRLKEGEIIQEGDEFHSILLDGSEGFSQQWLKTPPVYWGKPLKENTCLTMRRPILNSVEFIKEEL